ncbi:hypothetical protein PPL_09340 [Heterostelium album PN500]|uniref:B box-type domain-containing protein n=1 Tax=Heterostelium pallidum (strain ATCC 26659 / Pp 5 / PN500) TaxID=670386 RepID=D3BLA8_HETP5|nr:hypothetical protein PPL_09340 [Heterostelium album PN500]EFA77842.1 hypothetical protein PPL_09340 [Heterostelium album PN500]|eukprot:XP_020429970.1 hypothetical protein PPL_09340 [Heterostelium album PN500]
MSAKAEKCQSHPQKKVKFLCEECNILVCGDCITLPGHRGHAFVKPPNLPSQQVEKLNVPFEFNFDKAHKLAKKIKSHDEVTKNINKLFKTYHEQLIVEEHRLAKPVLESRQQLVTILEKYIAQLGGNDTLNTFERFNINTRKWDCLDSIPTKGGSSLACYYDNGRYIYLIGGIQNNITMDRIDKFDILTGKCIPLSTSDSSSAEKSLKQGRSSSNKNLKRNKHSKSSTTSILHKRKSQRKIKATKKNISRNIFDVLDNLQQFTPLYHEVITVQAMRQVYNTNIEEWQSQPKGDYQFSQGHFDMAKNNEYKTENRFIISMVASKIDDLARYSRRENRYIEPFNPDPYMNQFDVDDLEFSIHLVINWYEANLLEKESLVALLNDARSVSSLDFFYDSFNVGSKVVAQNRNRSEVMVVLLQQLDSLESDPTLSCFAKDLYDLIILSLSLIQKQ